MTTFDTEEDYDTGEDAEVREEWDEDAVMDELGDYLNSTPDQDRFTTYLWTFIHIMFGVATQGAWFFVLVAYWVWKFKRHLEKQPESYKKKYRREEVE